MISPFVAQLEFHRTTFFQITICDWIFTFRWGGATRELFITRCAAKKKWKFRKHEKNFPFDIFNKRKASSFSDKCSRSCFRNRLGRMKIAIYSFPRLKSIASCWCCHYHSQMPLQRVCSLHTYLISRRLFAANNGVNVLIVVVTRDLVLKFQGTFCLNFKFFRRLA